MRLTYIPLALGALALAACSVPDYRRARVAFSGTASIQAFRVLGCDERPMSSIYVLNGQGDAVIQNVKPYLTLTGPWSRAAESACDPPDERGAVLIRPALQALPLPCSPATLSAPPAVRTPCPEPPSGALLCAGGVCEVPALFADPPCAPDTRAAPADPCAPATRAAPLPCPPVARAIDSDPCEPVFVPSERYVAPTARTACGELTYTNPSVKDCEADPTYDRADLLRHAGEPGYPCVGGPVATPFAAPAYSPCAGPGPALLALPVNFVSGLGLFFQTLFGGFCPCR